MSALPRCPLSISFLLFSFAYFFSPNLEDSSRLKLLPPTVRQRTTHMLLSESSPAIARPYQTVWNFPQTQSTGPTWAQPERSIFHLSSLPPLPAPLCPQNSGAIRHTLPCCCFFPWPHCPLVYSEIHFLSVVLLVLSLPRPPSYIISPMRAGVMVLFTDMC